MLPRLKLNKNVSTKIDVRKHTECLHVYTCTTGPKMWSNIKTPISDPRKRSNEMLILGASLLSASSNLPIQLKPRTKMTAGITFCP